MASLSVFQKIDSTSIYFQLSKHSMQFQSFLSLTTFLAIGIVSLTVWTKKSEARIGCSYREINNLEKMVSEETAKKYIEWVCEGKKPDMPANFGRRKSHD